MTVKTASSVSKSIRKHASFFPARKTWVDFKDSRGQGVEDSSEMFKNYEERGHMVQSP